MNDINQKITVAIVLSGLMACSSVNEQDSRPYVGVGLVQSELKPRVIGGEADYEGRSQGAEVTVGVPLGKRVALEATLADLGEVDFGQERSLAYHSADVGLAVEVPVTKSVSVYGKAALGYLDTEAKGLAANDLYSLHRSVGAGVQASGDNWTARVGYSSWDEDAKGLTVALLHRIGKNTRTQASAGVATQPQYEPTAQHSQPVEMLPNAPSYIYFAPLSGALTIDENRQLLSWASRAKGNQVEITGFADSTTDGERAAMYADLRAQTVAAALRSRFSNLTVSVKPSQVVPAGEPWSAQQLINRRVEIRWTN